MNVYIQHEYFSLTLSFITRWNADQADALDCCVIYLQGKCIVGNNLRTIWDWWWWWWWWWEWTNPSVLRILAAYVDDGVGISLSEKIYQSALFMSDLFFLFCCWSFYDILYLQLFNNVCILQINITIVSWFKQILWCQ